MEKHRFNILPEMDKDEFEKLKADIQANGYDETQPVIVYQGAILDGWNRYKASKAVGVHPANRTFRGTPLEAIRLVERSNNRRNLSKEDWKLFWGNIYNLEKNAVGGNGSNQYKSKSASSAQLQNEVKELTVEYEDGAKPAKNTFHETAKDVADRSGYSPRSIKSFGKLAEIVEEKPELKEQFRAKEVTQTEILEQTKEPEAKTNQLEIVGKIHSEKIYKKLRELSNAISAADTAFQMNGANLEDFAPRLTSWRRETLEAQAKKLAFIEHCKLCGDGCAECSNGYLIKKDN